MIIGISGKIGSGKDTVGKIIQFLIWKNKTYPHEDTILYPAVQFEWLDGNRFEIKKFADKLKDIVCLLIDCTREQLENEVFKNTELNDNWVKYRFINRSNLLFTSKWYNSQEELDIHYEDYKILYPNDYIVKEDLYLTPRLLLQLLGTECGRNIIHPNVWVNALMNTYLPIDDTKRQSMGNIIDYSNCEYPNWIITDMRFPNELEAVKKRKGFTIRVYKPKERELILMNATSIIDTRKTIKLEHESETALDEYGMDHFIRNDGTIEDLIIAVKSILIQRKIITE